MIFILLQAIENESDRVLLTDLYTQHQRLFLYKANMYTRNSSHAEDVLQDAMIQVIRKVDTDVISVQYSQAGCNNLTVYADRGTDGCLC